jgi:hypothetical protein
VVRPTDRLERFGGNLANAWHALKNDFGEEDWQETLLDVRAGLGHEVDTVATRADPGGGQVALKIRYHDGAEESAHTLSDGTLAYLAFVVLHRLGRRPQTASSLLAFDEPEFARARDDLRWLEQPTIEVVLDQPLAKRGERALGERGVPLAEDPENHLPASVERRPLHRLRAMNRELQRPKIDPSSIHRRAVRSRCHPSKGSHPWTALRTRTGSHQR